MKSVIVVINRVKQYYLRNKAIFILFFLGGVLNAVVFAYMYGNLNPAKYKYGWTDIEYREYMVAFNAIGFDGGSFELKEPMRSYISDVDIQKVIESGLFESIMISFNNAYSYEGSGSRPDKAVSACVYGKPGIIVNTGSGEIIADDQVLVSENTAEPVGSIVTIYGKSFTVIGSYTASNPGGYGYIISEKALRQLNLNLNLIDVVSIERYHFEDGDQDVASKVLYSIFPDSFVSAPSRFEANDYRRAEIGIKTARNTFIISTLAFLFLIVYMADSLTDENAVSLIVGAKPSEIAVSVFWEGFSLSILASATGLALHKIFYEEFFEKINAYSGIEFYSSDYFRMLLIMVIVIAAVMLFVSLKYLFLTPINLRNKNT